MKRITKIGLIVFTLIFTAGAMFAQDAYNLNFKFEKGKTYFYKTNSAIESTQNMMGTEMTVNTISKSKMRFEVTDATPAQFEVIISFDSLYTKSNNPMGGDDIVNNGEGVVGKKTKYLFDNFGKKLKKIDIDAIKTSLQDMGSATNIFYQLSDKPVKIGESWNIAKKDTNQAGEDGKMIINSNMDCKVEGKEMNNGVECLKISVKGTVKLEGAMTQQGMNIVMEGTGKIGGFFYYDYAKGLMTYNESNTDMDMTAAIPDQSITIPITNKVKATIVLTDK